MAEQNDLNGSIAWDESHLGSPINGYCRNDHPQCVRPMEASARAAGLNHVTNGISNFFFFFVVGFLTHCNILFIFNLQRVMPLPAQAEEGAAPLRVPRNALITVTLHFFFVKIISHYFKSFLYATARAILRTRSPAPVAILQARPGGSLLHAQQAPSHRG